MATHVVVVLGYPLQPTVDVTIHRHALGSACCHGLVLHWSLHEGDPMPIPTIPQPAAVPMAVIAVAGLAVVLILWVLRGVRRRRVRDDELAGRWASAWSRCQVGPARFGRVTTVYQRASTGSKAIVDWHSAGGTSREDTWFEQWWARPGAWVVTDGGMGWGPHHQRMVRYVGPGQRLDVLPPDTPLAVQRHERRSRRRTSG